MSHIFDYATSAKLGAGYNIRNADFATRLAKKGFPSLINIFEEGIYDGRCVGLAFSCSWDDENGCGVLLINEHVKEIGYQDIVF